MPWSFTYTSCHFFFLKLWPVILLSLRNAEEVQIGTRGRKKSTEYITKGKHNKTQNDESINMPFLAYHILPAHCHQNEKRSPLKRKAVWIPNCCPTPLPVCRRFLLQRLLLRCNNAPISMMLLNRVSRATTPTLDFPSKKCSPIFRA